MVTPSGPVEALLLVGFDPLQPPEAVHEVAFVVLQVSVATPLVATLVGCAVSVTTGDCSAWGAVDGVADGDG